jgi:predicted Zn-dependent peptidase
MGIKLIIILKKELNYSIKISTHLSNDNYFFFVLLLINNLNRHHVIIYIFNNFCKK